MDDEVVVEPDLAGYGVRGLLGEGDEDVRRRRVGAALEQPGQQEIALLPPDEVPIVLGGLAPGQQLLRLELDQDGRDEEELRQLVEVDHVPLFGQDAHKVVDHGEQGNVEDVQLVGGHEVEQEVDRALEGRSGDRVGHLPTLSNLPTSRAPLLSGRRSTSAPYHGAP